MNKKMLHSITDYQVQNADFNKKSLKGSFNHNKKQFKLDVPCDNYFGKGNKTIDNYNKKRIQKENDEKFLKTKNKIKLVVYRNGFILNNGLFRDSSVPENSEFLKDVEKGNIPQELIRKGINDLGILLINRKSETFRSKLYQSMPTSINYIDINQNQSQSQSHEHILDQFFLNQDNNNKNGNMNSSYVPLYPLKYVRDAPIYKTSTSRFPNTIRINKKKRKTVPENNYIKVIDLIEGRIERKKYIAFSGIGKLLGASFIEEYKENEVKSFIDNKRSPSCLIGLRLYNGEIIKGQFNYSQTLKDIYFYTKELSGLNDFALLDGFPPKPLFDLDKTIGELNLENSVLTQKI